MQYGAVTHGCALSEDEFPDRACGGGDWRNLSARMLDGTQAPVGDAMVKILERSLD